MKKIIFYEARLFFTAMMFFTRLPVPRYIDHGSEYLQRSSKYFSWIGVIVGAITALSTFLFLYLFSTQVSVLLGMVTGILATGAFHEDGFADACDAFGGGWTKDKILAIMKDSRLGTFGVIGLIAILSIKFFLLEEIIKQLDLTLKFDTHSIVRWFAIIIWSHTLSRFAAVTMLQQYEYVSDTQTSKSKPLASSKLLWHEWIVGAIPVVILMFLLPFSYLLVLPCVLISRLYLGWYFNKWIGGYTGDCLGAVQQVCEVIIYLTITVIWKFT